MSDTKIQDITKEEFDNLYYNNNVGYNSNIICECGNGHLILRKGFSKFFGCSNYPNCKEKYVPNEDYGKIEIPMRHQLANMMNLVDNSMDYDYGEDVAICCKDDM